MKLIHRKYQSEDDYWAIRRFLSEVFLLNDCREVGWPAYRWDYWRWHVNENIFRFDLSAAVFLWETVDGRLAAVLHPEGPGEAFLQAHPAWRSTDLEVAMMSVAETQFAVTQADGSQRLVIWAQEGDTLRQDLLQRRGYSKGDMPEYQRRRCLDMPIPNFRPPAGYTLRALGDADEHPARSWLSWKAFHPDEPDESYEGWEWYRNVQRAPLYRRDLDLVAVAPDGELAAFCTLWLDDVTRTAAFEPVGTHPAQQRRGLGRALMAEVLRRVRDLHDAVTQTLFSTTLIADVLPELWAMNPEEGRRRLEELRQMTRGALAAAIRSAKAGKMTLSPEATQALVRAAQQAQETEALTEREREGLKLMVEGLNNAEIAERLVVSLSTVKYHISNILGKLGVDNRVSAVTMAIQRKMV